MRSIIFLLVFSLFLCCSCKKNESIVEIRNITYTECLVKPKDLQTSVSWSDNILHIEHKFMHVDCNFCGIIVNANVDKENRVIEVDVDPAVIQSNLEDCECKVNVSYELSEFYKKNIVYTVIIRENNSEIYRGEVEI